MLSMLPLLRWLLVLAALLCLMLALDLLLVAPSGMQRVFDARSGWLLGVLAFDALAVFLLVKHVGHDNSCSSLSSLVALLLATATLHAAVIAWQVVAFDRALHHTQALHQLERLRKQADVLETDFSDTSTRSTRYLHDGWDGLEKSLLAIPAASAKLIPQWHSLVEDATLAKHAIESLPSNTIPALGAKQRARQAVEEFHEQINQSLDTAIETQQTLALSGRHLCGALCATFALLIAGLHGFSRRVERWLDDTTPAVPHIASFEGDTIPLHAYFEASQHPFLLVDAQGVIQGVNAACRSRYPALVLGGSLLEAVEPAQLEALAACVQRSQPLASRATTLRDAHQQARPVILKFDDYSVLEGEPLLLVAIEEGVALPAPVCRLPRRHQPNTATKPVRTIAPPKPQPAPHVPFTHGWKADVVGVSGRHVAAPASKVVCTEPANARFAAGRFIGMPLVAARPPAQGDLDESLHTNDTRWHMPSKPTFQRRAIEQRDGKVVLLVEDDAPVRDTLQSILQHQGHRVVAVRDNAEAVELAARNRFDLLVADLETPESNGLELIAQLRRTQPNLKVLYLTSFLNHSSQPTSPMGADYLQKPFSAVAFLQKIGGL